MFLIFVVFPASWTAFAPVSRMTLERDNENITASVKRCMFFVVPYYTQRLTNVSNVRIESYKGKKQGFNANLSEAENRLNRRGTSEDNFELVLSNGKGDELRAPIDLNCHDSVQRDVESFIASGENGRYSVSILANRTLYWLSFPIVLLTAMYVLIQGLAITRLILGNPYWPFSIELANQMNEFKNSQREVSRKRSS